MLQCIESLSFVFCESELVLQMYSTIIILFADVAIIVQFTQLV